MSPHDKEPVGWKQKFKRELIEYWLTVAYMVFFFTMFITYKRLILAHHHIEYMDYGISLIKALVLAKVVMIGSLLKLDRGFENKPLIFPALFKAFTFTVWVFLFAVLEAAFMGWLKAGGPLDGIKEFLDKGRYELLGNVLVVFSSFIPFFAFKELGRVIGKNKVQDLFFRGRTLPDADMPQ